MSMSLPSHKEVVVGRLMVMASQTERAANTWNAQQHEGALSAQGGNCGQRLGQVQDGQTEDEGQVSGQFSKDQG